MMRAIKFRAWLKNENRYINVNRIDFADGTLKDSIFGNEFYDFNDLVLEQFTGLHDKNIVDIYENDVVKYFENTGVVKFVKDRFEINWDDVDCCNTEDLYFWATKRKIEIIGNIHEVKQNEI